MKVPLSLLKEFLDLPPLSPEEIAGVLTLAGLEVDEVRVVGGSFSGVVVATVLEVNKHPSADRLKVARVFDGTEEFQIVCGAPNCREGIKTPLARIGAQLTDETGKKWTMKKSRLRDVDSFGMLCAADELQMGQGEGIWELPADLSLGSDLSTLYSDVIFELSLTPNLGHCLSMLGIARELAAHLGIPVREQAMTLQETSLPIAAKLSVALIDKKQCLRYACRLVTGISVGPSPEWLRKKIEGCGLRSINNVVDVGNLVMLERGQPLHLFDYDKIQGGKLQITSHTAHREMQTLDGVVRLIPPDVLLIADGEKPLCFAGVMGGASSAVVEGTVNVVIESAHFVPQAIRKATRLLSLRSDSSSRFEKGVDPEGVLPALEYAAILLQQVAGGSVAAGVIDVQSHPLERKKIACQKERVNALLGTALSTSEISQLLRRLGMEILEENLHQVLVLVPSHRFDVTREVDLIEEVARVYGYNNIPKPMPRQITSPLSNAPLYEMESKVREHLLREGLQEWITCDLISPEQSASSLMHAMTREHTIAVLQAHSVEQSVLRTTLLPGLLEVARYNSAHGTPAVAGFEVGRIHFKQGEEYVEPSVVGILIGGLLTPYHWDPKPRDADFFDLKGMVENLCSSCKLTKIEFEVSHFSQFHPGRQARILCEGALLGVLGEVHPSCGFAERLLFAQIDLHQLIALSPSEWKMAPIPTLPGSERDWTVSVDRHISLDQLWRAIRSVSSSLLEKVQLLDLYKSPQIGEDKKNITFRFFYRDQEKTVSFDEVEKEHARIVGAASVFLS